MADRRQEAEQALVPNAWLERVVRESKEAGDVKAKDKDEDNLKVLVSSEAWQLVRRFLDKKTSGLERNLSECVMTPGITAEEIGMRYLIFDQVKDFITKLNAYVERPTKAEIIKRATEPAAKQ
jgi:hypothetical protein